MSYRSSRVRSQRAGAGATCLRIIDVHRRPRGQHDRDRRDDARRDAAAAQRDVDETAPDATIPVDELTSSWHLWGIHEIDTLV